jgi:glucose-6-phosphate 1-dehydrogenase
MAGPFGGDESASAVVPADALVLFGDTGDLARKKIYPALLAMARRASPGIPVIAVAPAPGDAARQDAVEAAWLIIEPVLSEAAPVVEYDGASWGPPQSDALIAPTGRWRNPIPDA